MTSVSSGFLVDTNVLVYAHDPRDQAKQERALAVLNILVGGQRAVLSVQCLSEFFNVSTRRLPEPMSRSQALSQLARFVHSCRILDLTPVVVMEGCRGATEHGLSLWDALIWAVAKLNQVPVVLTEDAEHERFLEGVRFLNPFAPSFDLKVLGGGS